MRLPRPGERYAVRCTTEDPRPGAVVTDVVGVVLSADADTWTVLPDDRGPVTLPAARVVASRRVPPRRVRPGSSVADVERLAARGWPGTQQARLGGWLLRVGHGCTARANSALVAGDPGLPLEEAVDAVAQFYRARGLPPRVQVAGPLHGSATDEVDAALARRGWQTHSPTHVLVADLRTLPAPDTPPARARTASQGGDAPEGAAPGLPSWADEPDDEWLSPGSPADDARPGLVAEMTACPARYLRLVRDGATVARARLVATDDWAGVSGLVVAPGARREGLGRQAMGEVVREARRLGARFGYLQVRVDDTAARALYEAAGWAPHHRYHYRVGDAATTPATS